MPGLYEEITIKIIELPYVKGEDVFVKVVMWGDPKKFEFEMKVSKTIWYSIYEHLKTLEDSLFDKLFLFSEDSGFKMDEELSYLKDRIITVKGVPDKEHEIITKTGQHTFAKIFTVDFRYDLEEAERFGLDSEEYRKAVFEYVIDNLSCKTCRLTNTALAKNDLIKRENKEKEKEEKRQEKKKKEKEVEWVKKKKEKEEKDSKKLKKQKDYWEQFL